MKATITTELPPRCVQDICPGDLFTTRTTPNRVFCRPKPIAPGLRIEHPMSDHCLVMTVATTGGTEIGSIELMRGDTPVIQLRQVETVSFMPA